MSPKRCSCGKVHDAAAWRALPLVGFVRDEVVSLELRNCDACSSTLAIEVAS